MTFFFHQMHTLFYITSEKTEQTNHFQYTYVFYNQDNTWRIKKFYYNYTTRKLNFWSWNKAVYM